MKKIDESKLEYLKKVFSDIPDEQLSTEEIEKIIKSNNKLNEVLCFIFIDYSDDKISIMEEIDNIDDIKIAKVLKTYLNLYSFMFDENQFEDESKQFDDIDSSYYSDDNVNLYLKEIGLIPLLSVEEEVQLFTEYKNLKKEIQELSTNLSCNAKLIEEKENNFKKVSHKISTSNLRLVVSIAKRYVGSGIPFLDLIQNGNLGLLRAVEMFDVSKGYKFSTYATWWIRQAITRAIADQARTIRIPVHMVEKINKVEYKRKELFQNLCREPSEEELAEAMDMPLEIIRKINRISMPSTSLDVPVGEGEHGKENTLLDFIEDRNSDVEKVATNGELREEIEKAFEGLTEKEINIIRLRFGLEDGKSRTLEKVGKEFGVTRERIRQIESKALRKLRNPCRSNRLREFYEEF